MADPFSDVVGKDQLVAARGSFTFFKVAVVVNNVVVAPDTDAFAQVSPKVVRILDPDGVDVTAAWVTNVRDPDDTTDTFDAAHVDYVGDIATPNYTGLFAQGYNNGVGVLTGRIAQKAKVPVTAEITSESSTRSYTVEWSLKKNGQVVTKSEKFEVSAAADLSFSPTVVTAAEVTRAISTSLSATSVLELAQEATDAVYGKLEDCGASITFATLPRSIRTAIIWWTRGLIFKFDASAHSKVGKLREGSRSVEFVTAAGGNREDPFFSMAEQFITGYCKQHGARFRPSMTRARRLPGDGAHIADGQVDAEVSLQ